MLIELNGYEALQTTRPNKDANIYIERSITNSLI